MRTVSFQGSQLSPGQRRTLQQQSHVKAFMSPVLTQQVAETLQVMEVRKEQAVKPERVLFVDRQETGTISVAEWMGF
ncbi:hypothetical protein V2J70_11940 [Pseudomonas alliivorans]|nr:hypothetical protein [Pseudomonas alliivorans]